MIAIRFLPISGINIDFEEIVKKQKLQNFESAIFYVLFIFLSDQYFLENQYFYVKIAKNVSRSHPAAIPIWGFSGDKMAIKIERNLRKTLGMA